MDSRSGRLDSAILPSANLLGNRSPRLASDIPPSARLLGSRSPRLAGSALLLGAQRAGPRACPIQAAPRAAKGLQEGGRSTLQHVR